MKRPTASSLDAESSRYIIFRSVLLLKPKLHLEISSGADTFHSVFLDISESLDRSQCSVVLSLLIVIRY